MPVPFRLFSRGLPLLISLCGLLGCSASAPATRPSAQATLPPAMPTITPPPPAATPEPFPVMLGIDVLEAQGFAPLKGKRVALLSHPAGVNRRGESTIDVLRRAPGVKLVALFGPEHGIYGKTAAGKDVPDGIDQRTGLPAFSLYGATKEPTKAQLRNIDVFVIDLQDIGVRSYTFAPSMKYAIEGCFKNGVEVMVLDRPNPLGGLKVDGPLLDASLRNTSLVAAYRLPYVHGLTIGELARMAHDAPGVLDIPDAVRARGKLTVIPMRGWKRSMRWPETGLHFVPTSPLIEDFPAVVGYAMIGLGTSWKDFIKPAFVSGIGTQYPFRGLSYTAGRTPDQLMQDLNALHIPGIAFRKISVADKKGQPTVGLYVDVVDWDAWRPTELSFELLRLNCRLQGRNPFANLSKENTRTINIHIGSMEWWTALQRDGAKVDVEGFIKLWQERNAIYQQQSKKYWLYD